MVDNGLKKFGGEIEFRGKLESAIANYKGVKGQNRKQSSIPIVVIVLNGGPNTLETVYNSVKNGSLCIFIKGSGECADLFAEALSDSTPE